MGTVTTATLPLPIGLPALNVNSYGTSTAYPVGLSRDRKTLYGGASPMNASGSGNTLYQSTDDGATWTSVFAFASTQIVAGLLETDDGEALCIVQDSAFGYVWKSTGWATSHTTATWTQVLKTGGGYIAPYWSGGHWCSFGDDTILAGSSKFGVIANYGPQSTASGSQATKAVFSWTTNDYGATWTPLLDLTVRYPAIAGIHWHATAYDPYWDRIWMTYGDTDTGTSGTTNMMVIYSDDRGVTWTDVASPTEWVGGFRQQCTTISVLEDAIVFHNDSRGGPWRVPRKSYRKMGQAQQIAVVAGNTGENLITTGSYKHRGLTGAPLLYGHLTEQLETAPSIFVSLDGLGFHELWRDDNLKGSNGGVSAMFGPTYNGKIVARVFQGSAPATPWLLRGELVENPSGLLHGLNAFTGDGTTTAFVIPHGLSVAPSRHRVFPQTGAAAAAYTYTVDATNITVTYTTAPAASAKVVLAWRAGV